MAHDFKGNLLCFLFYEIKKLIKWIKFSLYEFMIIGFVLQIVVICFSLLAFGAVSSVVTALPEMGGGCLGLFSIAS